MIIDINEYKKIPYLNIAALNGKVINLMPLWTDDCKWHSWIPFKKSLMMLSKFNVLEGDYVGHHPEDESDCCIPFIDIMWKYLNYPQTYQLISTISNNLNNMGCSLPKIHCFFLSKDSLTQVETARVVGSELDYLIILARGIFDLIQEIVAELWTYIRFNDKNQEKKRKQNKLPKTFSHITLIDKKETITAREITEKYGIPLPIAEKYTKYVDFFWGLRTIRNSIIHGFERNDQVFITEKGFCISSESKLFSNIQCHKYPYNKNVVSILPLFSAVIINTVNACNDIADSIITSFTPTPLILPEYHIFTKGPISRNFSTLDKINSGGSPWW